MVNEICIPSSTIVLFLRGVFGGENTLAPYFILYNSIVGYVWVIEHLCHFLQPW